MAAPQKLPPRTDRDRLNDLIDFYNAHKKDGGPQVIAVKFRPEELAKFADPIEGQKGDWRYRNRILRVVK